MTCPWELAGRLLGGALASARPPWPLLLHAVLCDLRPRFLVKSAVGPGHRAVARNGRVLLCSDRPPDQLAGRAARVRLQTWHRAVLPGEASRPYGVLLCVRCLDRSPDAPSVYAARLVRRDSSGEPADLELDVGGQMVLEFRASGDGL